MDLIMANALMAEYPDEARIRDIIETEIEKGAPAFDAFTKESVKKKQARKRKWERENKEYEASAPDMSSLLLAMSQRNQERIAQSDNFLDHLAEKYAPKKKNKSKRGGKWIDHQRIQFDFCIDDYCI